jgi:hypothetical protein
MAMFCFRFGEKAPLVTSPTTLPSLLRMLLCSRAGAPVGITSPTLRLVTPSASCFLITCKPPSCRVRVCCGASEAQPGRGPRCCYGKALHYILWLNVAKVTRLAVAQLGTWTPSDSRLQAWQLMWKMMQLSRSRWNSERTRGSYQQLVGRVLLGPAHDRGQHVCVEQSGDQRHSTNKLQAAQVFQVDCWRTLLHHHSIEAHLGYQKQASNPTPAHYAQSVGQWLSTAQHSTLAPTADSLTHRKTTATHPFETSASIPQGPHACSRRDLSSNALGP